MPRSSWPTKPSDGDLLDRYEAVQALINYKMSPLVWKRRAANPADPLPAPDETVHDIPHWYRSTVRAWDDGWSREHPGRPTGTTGVGYDSKGTRSAAAAQRAALILAELKQTDRPSASEVAKRHGLAERTVQRIAKAAREGS